MAEKTERTTTVEMNKADIRRKRRKTKMKRRLTVFVFLFLCAAVILTVLKAPFFNIKSIECVGQEKLSRKEILKAADIDTGTNVFSVNIESVKRKVAAIPAVSDSNVRRIFPNKIKIWVRECKEAGYISLNGQIAVVDPNGKIIKIVSDDEETKAGMAEILGIEAVTDKPGNIISAEEDIVARELYECMGTLDKLGMLDKVSLIDLSDASDLKIGYDNRLEIYLGRYENLEYKLTFVGKVIAENISDYEKAKLDYRGDKLYVGPVEEETVPEENAEITEENPAEESTQQEEKTDGSDVEKHEEQ